MTIETRKRKIWENVLKDICHCYPDSAGNRLCDNGSMCNRCNADYVQNIYTQRLNSLNK